MEIRGPGIHRNHTGSFDCVPSAACARDGTPLPMNCRSREARGGFVAQTSSLPYRGLPACLRAGQAGGVAIRQAGVPALRHAAPAAASSSPHNKSTPRLFDFSA